MCRQTTSTYSGSDAVTFLTIGDLPYLVGHEDINITGIHSKIYKQPLEMRERKRDRGRQARICRD